MSYNQPLMQPGYVNVNKFDNQVPVKVQQQQMPVSPPVYHSPLSYDGAGNRPLSDSHSPSSSSSSSSSVSSGGMSMDFETLRYKNDMCKSFEDDLFYCPRSLLSAQEQLTCERMDFFMAEQMRDMQILQQQSMSSPNSSLMRPKFNPYTSQSFSPAPNG